MGSKPKLRTTEGWGILPASPPGALAAPDELSEFGAKVAAHLHLSPAHGEGRDAVGEVHGPEVSMG